MRILILLSLWNSTGIFLMIGIFIPQKNCKKKKNQPDFFQTWKQTEGRQVKQQVN